MSSDFSREAVLEFLDFMANKGLMNRATAVSRKAAVNTLLSILSPEEASDIRGLKIDDLVMRFNNLKPREFKPDSLRVYKSRLNSVIEDFERYKADPLSFKPKITPKDRSDKASKNGGESQRTASRHFETGGAEATGLAFVKDKSSSADEIQSIVFPIPIRPGVIVRVAGIPSDLTPEEAQKIGNVVLALSGSQEG